MKLLLWGCEGWSNKERKDACTHACTSSTELEITSWLFWVQSSYKWFFGAKNKPEGQGLSSPWPIHGNSKESFPKAKLSTVPKVWDTLSWVVLLCPSPRQTQVCQDSTSISLYGLSQSFFGGVNIFHVWMDNSFRCFLKSWELISNAKCISYTYRQFISKLSHLAMII